MSSVQFQNSGVAEASVSIAESGNSADFCFTGDFCLDLLQQLIVSYLLTALLGALIGAGIVLIWRGSRQTTSTPWGRDAA